VEDVSAEAFDRLQGEPFALLHKPTPPARVAERLAELIAQSAA
jgi:hypothetical protein